MPLSIVVLYRCHDTGPYHEIQKVLTWLPPCRRPREFSAFRLGLPLPSKRKIRSKLMFSKINYTLYLTKLAKKEKIIFLLYSEEINSKRLIGFMEALIKMSNGRKVYFILDNLKVHHSKLVSQWGDVHKDEIAHFYLPPYSLECTPDEYLNNDLKQSIGTQAPVRDIQVLETNTFSFMGRLSDDPDHVKAYFDHPALTKYKLD